MSKYSDYVTAAMRTKSTTLNMSEENKRLLVTQMRLAMKALNDLSAVKAAIFYNRELPVHIKHSVIEPSKPTDPEMCNPDLLHSALLVATEGGEMLENLLRVMQGAPFDEVNFLEELGDAQWGAALSCDTLGVTLEQVQQINIDKLQARYPEKFTNNDANERDLEREREALKK